jgi:hypothetical protein
MKITPSTPVAIRIGRIDNPLKFRFRKPARRKRPNGRAFHFRSRVFNEPTVLNAECTESRQTGELAIRSQAVVSPGRAEIDQLRGSEIAQADKATVLRPGKQLLLEQRLGLLGCFLGEIASGFIGKIRFNGALDCRYDRP